MTLEELIARAESALAGNTVPLTGKSTEERLSMLRGEEEDPRLQQLREEFEAERDAILSRPITIDDEAADIVYRTTFASEFPDRINSEPDEWTSGHVTWEDEDALSLAARRYIIARDFNVFDPDKADMLWKLQRQ
jgi:hypothetical protein